MHIVHTKFYSGTAGNNGLYFCPAFSELNGLGQMENNSNRAHLPGGKSKPSVLRNCHQPLMQQECQNHTWEYLNSLMDCYAINTVNFILPKRSTISKASFNVKGEKTSAILLASLLKKHLGPDHLRCCCAELCYPLKILLCKHFHGHPFEGK